MPLTSARTAWRVRACIRSPPSAGSDSTAVRRCGSVSISRYRPSSSRSGSSVRPTTRSHSCCRAWSPSRATAVSTSSQPVVNGSLTTSTSQASRSSPPGGSRSLIRRAISVGEAGSATRPTWIGFIARHVPRHLDLNNAASGGRPPAVRSLLEGEVRRAQAVDRTEVAAGDHLRRAAADQGHVPDAAVPVATALTAGDLDLLQVADPRVALLERRLADLDAPVCGRSCPSSRRTGQPCWSGRGICRPRCGHRCSRRTA